VGTEKYRQIAERGTGTVETRWQCKDGRLIDVLLSSTPIDPLDTDGGVTFTALDITERKRSEDALRQANLVVENSPVVVFRCFPGQSRSPRWCIRKTLTESAGKCRNTPPVARTDSSRSTE
jgi:PAS domain-containing protein